jgi:glutathione S-transferase
MVEKSVKALESLAEGGDYLVGGALSLADLHLAPVIEYFSNTPEGKKVMPGAPRLSAWWAKMSARPSVQKTRPQLG